jgi:hypothetical protein
MKATQKKQTKNTKITLSVSGWEMQHSIEPVMLKYFNRRTKPKTKEESKRLLEMFTSSMLNKAILAVKNDEQYVKISE